MIDGCSVVIINGVAEQVVDRAQALINGSNAGWEHVELAKMLAGVAAMLARLALALSGVPGGGEEEAAGR